jgi:hypothetical protein
MAGCVIYCPSMTYSTGIRKNSSVCACKSNYKWDNIIGQCIANTSNSHAVAIALGIALPLAFLGLVALAFSFLWIPQPVAFPMGPIPQAPPMSRLTQLPITSTRLTPNQLPSRRVIGSPVKNNMMNITPNSTALGVMPGGVSRF